MAIVVPFHGRSGSRERSGGIPPITTRPTEVASPEPTPGQPKRRGLRAAAIGLTTAALTEVVGRVVFKTSPAEVGIHTAQDAAHAAQQGWHMIDTAVKSIGGWRRIIEDGNSGAPMK